MIERLKEIKFRQPKYILPAILYPLLIGAGYLIIDMFSTKIEDLPDKDLQTTEYLNSNLPQAQIQKGDGIGGKYENMQKSFGRIGDLSAVENIDRDEDDMKEEYDSHYTEEDLAIMDSVSSARELEELQRAQRMQKELEESLLRGQEMSFGGEYSPMLTDDERLRRSEERERQAMAELEKALAETRLKAQQATQLPEDGQEQPAPESVRTGSVNVNTGAVTELSEHSEPEEMVKRRRPVSDFFNTIRSSRHESSLISAIIDEDIRAVEGSRVRLRLLDDVDMGEVSLQCGDYVYAIMSGFGSQRVKGTVSSVLVGDRLVKVSMSLYDTDGLEGLYIPESTFRETAKDVTSSALAGNMNLGSATPGSSLSQWGMQAVQNAYQKSTGAVSKAIKKNSAELKYGTFVYLVNGREKK